MWCGACQQDVPGVVTSSEDHTVRCARCARPLRDGGGGGKSDFSSRPEPSDWTTLDATGAGHVELPEFVELEDWEFEETIRQAQRSVQGAIPDSPVAWDLETRVRADAPHGTTSWQSGELSEPATTSTVPAPRNDATWPWAILALGLGVSACGAALMGFSLGGVEPILWQLGLPMLLAGQVAVLFVVIWQLEVVWHSHRATFVALHSMDDQLRQWRRVLDGTSGGLPSETAFFRHVREGAAPHVLLEDLKQQIDILAQQLDTARRAA